MADSMPPSQQDTMPGLPSLMIPGILSHLEVKDVCRCACISKEWKEWTKREPLRSMIRLERSEALARTMAYFLGSISSDEHLFSSSEEEVDAHGHSDYNEGGSISSVENGDVEDCLQGSEVSNLEPPTYLDSNSSSGEEQTDDMRQEESETLARTMAYFLDSISSVEHLFSSSEEEVDAHGHSDCNEGGSRSDAGNHSIEDCVQSLEGSNQEQSADLDSNSSIGEEQNDDIIADDQVVEDFGQSTSSHDNDKSQDFYSTDNYISDVETFFDDSDSFDECSSG